VNNKKLNFFFYGDQWNCSPQFKCTEVTFLTRVGANSRLGENRAKSQHWLGARFSAGVKIQAVTEYVGSWILDHHLPTLSLEHLSLSLKSNLALHSLLNKPYTLNT
jgi:hypothetical protein